MKVILRKVGSRNTPLYAVELGSLTLYFSYETCVAFDTPYGKTVVSKNVWSTTTGRHLNEIDGGRKDERVEHAEFKRRLAEVLAQFDDAPLAVVANFQPAPIHG